MLKSFALRPLCSFCSLPDRAQGHLFVREGRCFCGVQTQLVLHMAQMGDKYFSNGTRLKKPASHPVDVRKFASANNNMLNKFALWNVDPTRRPLGEGTRGLLASSLFVVF